MSSSFTFDEITALVPMAEGPPGNRRFTIAVVTSERTVRFACEKAQVAALAEYLGRMADAAGVGGTDAEGAEPETGEPAWTIGRLTVGAEPSQGRIVVVFDEYVPFVHPSEERAEPATANIPLGPRQARRFTAVARALVSAGRPLCRRCELPIDPDGHQCPALN